MKYVIEITCNNSAFDDCPEHEVNRILKKLAKQQANGPLENRKLIDINGNYVGKVVVAHEPRDITVHYVCPVCGQTWESVKTECTIEIEQCPGCSMDYFV